MAQEYDPLFPLEQMPAVEMPPMDTSPNGTDHTPVTTIPNDSIDPRLLSLAMGFVPRQIWETPYDTEVALSRGTIFPSLDKPFMGWRNSKEVAR